MNNHQIEWQSRILTATTIILTAILDGYVFHLVATSPRSWWNPAFALIAVFVTITVNHVLEEETETK